MPGTHLLTVHAPDLIDYEFVNAMWVAGKMGRISAETRDAAVRNFLNIEITKTNIGKIFESLLTIATEHNRSCYDAAYLTLSQVLEAPWLHVIRGFIMPLKI